MPLENRCKVHNKCSVSIRKPYFYVSFCTRGKLRKWLHVWQSLSQSYPPFGALDMALSNIPTYILQALAELSYL